MTKQQMTKFFGYLDVLRETGITNMFGAAPYLANAFGLERNKARTVLLAWMQTFSEEPASVRAERAIASVS